MQACTGTLFARCGGNKYLRVSKSSDSFSPLLNLPTKLTYPAAPPVKANTTGVILQVAPVFAGYHAEQCKRVFARILELVFLVFGYKYHVSLFEYFFTLAISN